MKIWLIWVQDPSDEATWLAAAWDDERTAESRGDYEADIDRIQQMCLKNRYEMRIQAVNVPGVYNLFEIPEVTAEEVL